VGQIDVPMEQVEAFCRRWKITELAFFGSALRDDFRPDSDVDVLVTFEPDARWSSWDMSGMKFELEEIFGRSVDILTRRAVEASRN
jgi:predicted nucleotidyltransferase